MSRLYKKAVSIFEGSSSPSNYQENEVPDLTEDSKILNAAPFVIRRMPLVAAVHNYVKSQRLLQLKNLAEAQGIDVSDIGTPMPVTGSLGRAALSLVPVIGTLSNGALMNNTINDINTIVCRLNGTGPLAGQNEEVDAHDLGNWK